ncbi:MAG: copper chaperone PCu(A)C [Filomicrobium sp.]
MKIRNSDSPTRQLENTLKIASAALILGAFFTAPALACEKHDHSKAQQTKVETTIQSTAKDGIVVAEAKTGHSDHSSHGGHKAASGTVKIGTPWTRVTPPGAKVAGGFVTLTNTGDTEDRLIGGSFELAGRVEVHEMSVIDGVMRMNEVDGGIELAPGATVELKPGSYHLMFMELKASPKLGQPVKGTLKFANAGEVEVSFSVAELGAKTLDGKASAKGGDHHDHGSHGSGHNH